MNVNVDPISTNYDRMHCSFIKEKLIHLSNSVNKNNSAHALTMQDAKMKFKAAQGAEELKPMSAWAFAEGTSQGPWRSESPKQT